jgi:hypothetical protein
MSFTADDGSVITLTQGAQWTLNYRNSSYYTGTKAVFYGKNKIASILNQTGAVGMRIYFAINDHDESTVVLVGTNVDGNNLESGTIVERGILCPPMCPTGGSL